MGSGTVGRGRLEAFFLLVLLFAATVPVARAVESDLVPQDIKLNDAALGGVLASPDEFGSGVDAADVNGDGVPDAIVGARRDGGDSGAIYILLLDSQGNITSQTRIADTPGVLDLGGSGLFGSSIAALGDYDGDGNFEIAVGEHLRDSTPNVDDGRVWILDVDATGALQSAFDILSGSPNFASLLTNDYFGFSLANLGDWNNDGAPELGVGALKDADGQFENGAAYILYLSPPPTPGANATGIETYAKISDTEGGFDLVFDTDLDWFGSSVTGIGDLDADGQIDLAVGARRRNPAGAVFVLFMDPGCSQPLPATPPVPNSACSVDHFVEIGSGIGGFPDILTAGTEFGSGLAWLGGGTRQLAVGQHLSGIGATAAGAVRVVTLTEAGTAGWPGADRSRREHRRGHPGGGSVRLRRSRARRPERRHGRRSSGRRAARRRRRRQRRIGLPHGARPVSGPVDRPFRLPLALGRGLSSMPPAPRSRTRPRRFISTWMAASSRPRTPRTCACWKWVRAMSSAPGTCGSHSAAGP